MSVKVSGQVWDSDLDPNIKFVALCYADHADHDGRNVYPSQATVAELTGYSPRTIRRLTAELKKLGVLVPDGKGPGRRPDRLTNRYFFDVSALPKKANEAQERGDKVTARKNGTGGSSVRNGGTNCPEREDTSGRRSVNRSVKDPSKDSGSAANGRQPALSEDLKKPEKAEKKESAHQRLMRLYQEALGYKIPHGGKEGAGAKKILKAGHTPEEAVACYRWLKQDSFWAPKHLSLMKVHEQLGPWKENGRPGANGAADVTAEEAEAVNKKAMEKLRKMSE